MAQPLCLTLIMPRAADIFLTVCKLTLLLLMLSIKLVRDLLRLSETAACLVKGRLDDC